MDDLALRALEWRVRDSVAGDLRAALVSLEKTLTAFYLEMAGDTRHKLPLEAQAALRDVVGTFLAQLEQRDYATTRQVLIGGARAALTSGAEDLGATVAIKLPLDVRHALTALTAGMRADLADARRLVRHGSLERYGDLQGVLATARRALTRADRTAVWVVHRAHNEGRSRAIDKLWREGVAVHRLWRAEQDACIACLSFAGAIAAPGEPFASVVEVADASARPATPVFAPPLHPNCRCSVEEWLGAPERELIAVDLPIALRREAQRSIAGGRAQGSTPARLRAADRLVKASGLLLPKTVVRRAREAVLSSSFKRGK